MRILLVVPTHGYKGGGVPLSASDFPAGLAYIASSLKEAGHEVTGLNLNNIKGFRTPYLMMANNVQRALEDDYDLIGLGGLCIDYSFIKDCMQVIRRYTDTPIVLGGRIVSQDAEFIFNNLKPDYAIQGEGEETMVALADYLDKDEPCPIHNMWWWEGGIPQYGGANYDYRELDDRPFPDYEVFGLSRMVENNSMDTRILYRYPRTDPRPMIITTARACPFNCSFCIHQGGPKYRARSVENIMAEIKELYDLYKFNILIVGDELFAVNKKRMTEFCEALIDKKKELGWDFDWMFQTHANSKLDLATLKLAKESGCYFFSYGIESAAPAVLESMNKKTSPKQFVEAADLAKEVGIGFGGNLIFGDPAETEETINESLSFWAKYGGGNQIFISNLQPYPGCKIFDFCEENGLIPNKEEYYEHIGGIIYNMTQIPHDAFLQWMNFFGILERSWLTVESTVGEVSLNGQYHKISTVCPHCGEDNLYKEPWEVKPTFLGTGCQHCNRRIKVML